MIFYSYNKIRDEKKDRSSRIRHSVSTGVRILSNSDDLKGCSTTIKEEVQTCS